MTSIAAATSFAIWVVVATFTLGLGTMGGAAERSKEELEALQLFNQGMDSLAKGTPEEAVSSFEKAYAVFPNQYLDYNLGRAYSAMGNCAKALPFWLKAKDQVPAQYRPTCLDAIAACDKALGTSSTAQLTKLSPCPDANFAEIVVNDQTKDWQDLPSGAQSGSKVLLAWESSMEDGDDWGVFGRPLDKSGLGPAKALNTITKGAQSAPVIAPLPKAGSFVVAWASAGLDGSELGIAARIWKGASPTGKEELVNSYTLNNQKAPTVAAGKRSIFVAWETENQDGDGFGVAGRFLAFDGSPVGEDGLVNKTTKGNQRAPEVAYFAPSTVAATWVSPQGSKGATAVVMATIPAPSFEKGALVASPLAPSAEQLVSLGSSNEQQHPSLAATSDGGFVIVWEEVEADGSERGVMGMRFDASAAPVGAPFLVNLTTKGDQIAPMVRGLPGGGFVVVWQCGAIDGSAMGVALRAFGEDGAPLGGELMVNDTTAGDQTNPAIVAMDKGVLVMWEDPIKDGSELGVMGRFVPLASLDYSKRQSCIP